MGFDDNNIDFELYLNENNFSQIGEYAYIIQCNTSEVGGFVSGVFEVTTDGRYYKEDSQATIAITLFLIFITILMIYVSTRKCLTKSEILNLILKRSLYVLIIFFVILDFSILFSFAAISQLPILNFITTYITIFGWAGYLAMLYLVVKTMFDSLELWKDKKNNERFE